MPRFLISFGATAMDHLPDDAMPEVAAAAHEAVRRIIDAGAYVVAGGLEDRPSRLVAPDGTVTDGPTPAAVAGLTIVDVPTREEALQWAATIARACRCTQEVWAIGYDPELEAMLGHPRSAS